MKERNDPQDRFVHMPPAWCSAICRNSMNEVCIEHCAIERDCSYFEPKPNLKLSDMPRFPLKESESMTKEEKFTAVTVYLSKVVDHLQGKENEPIFTPTRRTNFDHSRNSTLFENIKVKDLLSSFHQEGNTAHEDRAKHQDSAAGLSELDGKTGQAT
jgi:hypothetical protein